MTFHVLELSQLIAANRSYTIKLIKKRSVLSIDLSFKFTLKNVFKFRKQLISASKKVDACMVLAFAAINNILGNRNISFIKISNLRSNIQIPPKGIDVLQKA